MYNNNITLSQLLRNKKLAGVLPQFTDNVPLQNVYSFAEIDRRVKLYLRGIFGARLVQEDSNRLIVQGKKSDVMWQLKQAKTLIEQFFNAMPRVAKNIRSNTRLLLPYATISQIANVTNVNTKLDVMQQVLDNINFNPNFNSLNSISNLSTSEFIKQQAQWAKKTGGALAQ